MNSEKVIREKLDERAAMARQNPPPKPVASNSQQVWFLKLS